MPTAEVGTTEENFTRIIAALRAKLDDEVIEGLTDGQIWRLDLKGYYTQMLYTYGQRQAAGAIAPEDDIVTVT